MTIGCAAETEGTLGRAVRRARSRSEKTKPSEAHKVELTIMIFKHQQLALILA